MWQGSTGATTARKCARQRTSKCIEQQKHAPREIIPVAFALGPAIRT